MTDQLKKQRTRPRLILASQSPRRLELLAQIGIVPDAVVAARVEEGAAKGELPGGLALRLAEAKARGVAADNPGALVLGADTVVARGRRVLPKAADEEQARRFLELLSGRRHRVYGGIAVIDAEGRSHSRLVMTSVSFKRLERAEIDAYIDSAEWRGKAGAYAIQGGAAAFVRKINGSYNNVVGLSLYETAALLKGLGYEPGE